MKLRVATKVYENFDKPGRKYRDCTIRSALARIDKCQSQKDLDRFWDGWMRRLGPQGRFDLVMSCKLMHLEERFSQTKEPNNASLQIQAH